MLFCRLVLYVCVHCYCHWLYLVSITCGASAIGCQLYCVQLFMKVVVACAYYSPMSPWSTIFSLDCYSWPYGNTWKRYCSIIVILLLVFLMILAWWWSSQSSAKGLQSMTGMMPWTGLLNINVAGLGKPWPNGVVWIWRSAMFMSLPELVHVLNVYFMNFMQASPWPLLWCWYADDVVCYILTDLQNWWNLSDTKLVPTSDISLQGMPYLAILFLPHLLGCLLKGLLVSWWLGMCYCSLQYTSNVYFQNEICLLQ